MISLDNVVGVLMPQQPEYDEAWKKFRDLLPILTCCGLSLKSRGYAYNACERSVLLYASEMWAATQKDVSHLNHNDTMMIGWILSVKLRDKAPSEELRSQLGLGSIENALRCGVSIGMVMFNVWSCNTLKTSALGVRYFYQKRIAW